MPKLTVYLSDDLVVRLQPYRDVLNLSEIARAAIEGRLRMEESAAGGDIRLQVLTRLRRGEPDKAAMRARGRDAGQSWARDVAKWSDMETVAKWPEMKSSDQLVAMKPSALFTIGMYLAQISLAKSTRSFPPVRAYIPLSVSCGPPPGTKVDMVVLYWSGFGDAVREVHALVKDQMEPPRTGPVIGSMATGRGVH
jgi:hypothetical protein